jgi:GT2 family glycosyltransferase
MGQRKGRGAVWTSAEFSSYNAARFDISPRLKPLVTERSVAEQLTVVIPTLGRDTLLDAVRSIAQGSVAPVEIIVSHQGVPGSMDGMLPSLRQFGTPVRYIHSDKRGCAAGRNTGIGVVATRNFATTDDDCTVDSKWVERMAAALELRPREIVTGQVLASEPGAPSTVTLEEPRLFTKATLAGVHFTGGNFGVALEVFNDIGPFDETELIRFCEDNEWAYRAFAKGYCTRYVPQIAITHLHWRDDSGLEQVYERYAHSQGGWYGRKLREGDLSFTVRVGYELMRGAKRWFVGSVSGDSVRRANGRAFVVNLLQGVAAGWNE